MYIYSNGVTYIFVVQHYCPFFFIPVTWYISEPPSISLSHQSVVHTVPGEGNTVIFCTGTGKPAPTVTFGGLECSGKDNGKQ